MSTRGIGSSCTYCGHPRHDDACPRQIVTAVNKKPQTQPCPCAWRRQEKP